MVLQNNLMGVEMLFEIKKSVYVKISSNCVFEYFFQNNPHHERSHLAKSTTRCYLQYDQMNKVYYFDSSCC